MEIIRGDTQEYKFQRKDANGDVITQEATSVYFTVKENYIVDKVLIQKTIEDMTFDSDGTYHFTITADDTNDLYYGDYVYDIEVKQGDEYTKTIAKGVFKISEEVTFESNEV